MQINDNVLGTKKILPLVVTLSLPIMFSMAMQALYNIVDSIFIARFDTTSFAEVSLTQPLMYLLSCVGSATGVGLSSLLSRRLGEKKTKLAEEIVGGAFALTLLLALCVPLVAFASFFPLFHLITQDEFIIKEGFRYASIIFMGFPFQIFSLEIGYLLQAQSRAKSNMLIQIAGCLTNIILDPIFIFSFNMGTLGAALATCCGFIVSFIFAIVLFYKYSNIRLIKCNIKLTPLFIKDVSVVGLPAFFTQASASIVGYILNGLVISYGVVALSVYGMYLKMESFMFLACQGIASALVSIVGYNYGAGLNKRIISSVRISVALGWSIMLIGFAIFQIFTPSLVNLFTKDEEVIVMGIPAFKSISFCFLLTAPQIIIGSFFQGVGKGGRAMIAMNVRFYALILPFAFLLSKFYGLQGLWFCYFAADLFSFPLTMIIYAFTKKKYCVKDE